jgi:hypothetical protein
MNRRIVKLIGVLVAVAGPYVGSYYATVDRKLPRIINGSGIKFDATYSLGGEWTLALFKPMNELDKKIRPSFWHLQFVE